MYDEAVAEANKRYENKTIDVLIKSLKSKLSFADKQKLLNDFKTNYQAKFVRFDAKDNNVNSLLKTAIENANINELYLFSSTSDWIRKITLVKKSNGTLVFKADRDEESSYDVNQGVFKFNFKPELKKVVNSNFWNNTKNCSSVQQHMNTIYTHEFVVESVIFHKDKELPIAFLTSIKEPVCGTYSIYSNCNISCYTTLPKGSSNYIIAIHEEVAKALLN
ncbi:MAG: hypothetical protein PQJ44_04995 [Sphaerochaetaceae bacterium]|nr:hypothetical protein [Sphaerochaetaceae bacterium]